MGVALRRRGFTAYKGIAASANYVAKLNLTSGTLDTTFSPVGTSANGFDKDGATMIVRDTAIFYSGALLPPTEV